MYDNRSDDINRPVYADVISAVSTEPLLYGISRSEYHDSVYENSTEEKLEYVSNDSYQDYQYDEYIYEVFKFELHIYLYIWEILVIIVSLVNCLVIVAFLDKRMRNQINMILIALSVSNSLTGLVTLPSYIQVFMKCQANNLFANNSTITAEQHTTYSYPCLLDKQLCQFFMISKYFLFSIFHTISIYLTLFLSCQRYISVAYPFNAQWILSVRNTVIVCVCIFIISPVLHIYQALGEKTPSGLCAWQLNECSTGGCAYIWIVLFLHHCIPCVLLLMVTGLFVRQLMKGEKNLKRMTSNAPRISRRHSDNRRISYIVVAIVVVFLVTEIPYGIFLLITAVLAINNDLLPFRTNRSFQAVYEISLVLSFYANFYIYIIFNNQFRKKLKSIFSCANGTLFRKQKSDRTRSAFRYEHKKTTETRCSCKDNNEFKSIGTHLAYSDDKTSDSQQVNCEVGIP